MTANVNTPTVFVDVSTGTEAVFCWAADASYYGGIGTGFRYGWDVLDPDDGDDPGWEIDWTPFVMMQECSVLRAFFFGTHTFTIQVIDNDGYKSRAAVTLNVLPTTPVEPSTWGFLKSTYRKR